MTLTGMRPGAKYFKLSELLLSALCKGLWRSFTFEQVEWFYQALRRDPSVWDHGQEIPFRRLFRCLRELALPDHCRASRCRSLCQSLPEPVMMERTVCPRISGVGID